MQKFVNLLKPEQQGMMNDAVINLAKLRKEQPEKFKDGWSKTTIDGERNMVITVWAKWHEDKSDPAKDEFIFRIRGLVTTEAVPRRPKHPTLTGDPNTALVDSVVVEPPE